VASLQDRVALVTGSTRGIGHAIATSLSETGCRVVIHGRDISACEVVAESIPGSVAMAGDLTDPTSADALVAQTLDQLGRLDILVNNAGVALDNFFTGVTDERWHTTLAANLSAPFVLMRAATRAMKSQQTGGAIVNLTSTSGERGNAGQAAYAASKAGLHGLTLTAAKELGRFGIRVNSVSPMVATELNGLIDPERAAAVGPTLPLGQVATTADVADLVTFLVSDQAKFITGELIHVDAGFHLI
jgi:3-oxoacyl-[acyl-carrier protein] reductase